MKRIQSKTVAIFLIVCILSLSGCKPTEKTEASVPVVSGTNAVKIATNIDASSLLGTQWKSGFTTLTISKDGKVHSEVVEGNENEGMLFPDENGNPCLKGESEGYIDGGYIIWTYQKRYDNDLDFQPDGSPFVKRKGESENQRVSNSLITYISEKTLILGEANTYIRVP